MEEIQIFYSKVFLFSFFLSHTMENSPLPFRSMDIFADYTINKFTDVFELNGISFGFSLSLTLGVEEIILTRTDKRPTEKPLILHNNY